MLSYIIIKVISVNIIYYKGLVFLLAKIVEDYL